MVAPTTHKKKVVRRSRTTRTTRTTTATKSPTSKKKAVSVVKDAFAKELKLSDRRKRQLLDRRLATARAKQLRRTSWYPYGKRTYTFEIPSRKRAGYYEVWSSNGFFLGGGSYT